jgi:site-specific DNA recombinase
MYKRTEPTPTDTRATVGYIRLTREESLLKNLSAPAQRHEIGVYASRAGLGDVEILEEPDAVGGDTPFHKRKAGRDLIKRIAAGEIGHLIVRDLDRLTRDLPLWLGFAELCGEMGTTLHTFSGELRNKSATDRFATNVRAAAAQMEREQVGDRVRKAKAQLARTGRHPGGPAPFGYRLRAKRLRINPTEAKVVALLFRLYVRERLGARAICNRLNGLGHRRRSGRPWHPDKIRRIISNPVVAGFMPLDEVYSEAGRGRRTPKADQRLHKGDHKAIVPEKVWRKAQAIRKGNRIKSRPTPQAHSRQYLLSGVIRCTCGAPMKAGSQNKHRAYYVCRHRAQYGPDNVGGCPAPRIPTDRADSAFLAKLTELITSDDLTDRVRASAQRMLVVSQRRDEPNPQDMVDKLKADLDLWYERHDSARSKTEKEAAWERIIQLTERRKELQKKAPVPEPLPTPVKITKAQAAAYLADLAASLQQTGDKGRSVIRALIEHHGLAVQIQDAETILISLALATPNGSLAVSLREEARIVRDKVAEWATEQQGKHLCAVCGEPVTIRRVHFWQGIPKLHQPCSLRKILKMRRQPPSGTITAPEAARLLCISRTEFGRWIKLGRITPIGRHLNALLFDSAAITALQ